MINTQPIRFVLVGMVNTLFGYGCFALLLFVGLHYALAGLLATVAGVIFNYKSLGILVFQSEGNSQILRFVAVYVFIYCISTICVGILNYANVTPYWGGAIMLLPMAFLSYLLNKHFVFKND